MKKTDKPSDLNRRDFLRGSSLTSFMMLMGGVEIKAQETPKTDGAPTSYKAAGPSVNCAVIGCGPWGREILKTLARRPNTPVLAVCDTYAVSLKRAKQAAPNAEPIQDYRKVLDNKEVQAVFVVTPSHLHREIVLAALQAGKHVYCEAPIASTIEDARVIAQAAKAAEKVNFQPGLQNRSDPQLRHLSDFIRTGAMGKTVMARSQWHKKQSWLISSPNPDREKEINWRLSKETSSGLIGEIGIHQVDVGSWFIMDQPVAVTGYGSIQHWKDDGRDVPDTIQAVIEYPGGVVLTFDCTLANSFDADYDIYYGTDSAIMVRERKAWMFKEVDSPLLGWEVYARKEAFYRETGIVLGANATKLKAQGDKPAEGASLDEETALSYAIEAFLTNSHNLQAGVEDFAAAFDINDKAALREYLTTLNKSRLAGAGFKEGYESAVTVIKANEAIMTGKKVTFQKEWFELA
ncbi:MAG: Gfo/Idh/MocA family oxidoreductase [Chloroflexi bacterium]|nr:Gfo/Idh/MocA family oxidoreductase [Chloroflexota bacterium]